MNAWGFFLFLSLILCVLAGGLSPLLSALRRKSIPLPAVWSYLERRFPWPLRTCRHRTVRRGERPIHYGSYSLSVKEVVAYASLYFFAAAIGGVLFFDQAWCGLVPALCCLFFFLRTVQRKLQKRRVRQLEQQFYRMLQLLSASLSAGISPDNCFRDIAESDACRLQANMNGIREELLQMDRLIGLRVDMASAFAAFAERSTSRDIQAFASALQAASSSGGNLVEMVRMAAASYQMKEEAEAEIVTCLSLPRLNHRILSVMPFCLIALLRMIAPSYLKPLYCGWGRAVMIVVSMVLLGAWFMGNRIADIRL